MRAQSNSRITSFKFIFTFTLAVGLWAGVSTNALANITFSGSNAVQMLSATATFSDSGSLLTVTLVNTYTGDTPDQAHVLTGLFFSGADGLTPVSATAGAGSVQWVGGTSNAPPSSSVLGQEWGYASGGHGNPNGANDGIAGAGFNNNFGSGNFASPGDMLDGSAYGILSAGYAGSDLDGLGSKTFIQPSMVFVLSGWSGVLTNINDVNFQYGTSLSEPNLTATTITIVTVPEPSGVALAIVGIALVGLLGLRRH